MLAASEQAVFAMAFLAVSNLANVRVEPLFSPMWQATMSHFRSAPVFCVGLHVQLGCVHSNCICSPGVVTGLYTFYSCRKAGLWGQSWPLFTFVVTVGVGLHLTSEGKEGDTLHSHVCWAEFKINHQAFFRRMRDVRLNRSDTSSRMSSYKVQRSRESLEKKKVMWHSSIYIFYNP